MERLEVVVPAGSSGSLLRLLVSLGNAPRTIVGDKCLGGGGEGEEGASYSGEPGASYTGDPSMSDACGV